MAPKAYSHLLLLFSQTHHPCQQPPPLAIVTLATVGHHRGPPPPPCHPHSAYMSLSIYPLPVWLLEILTQGQTTCVYTIIYICVLVSLPKFSIRRKFQSRASNPAKESPSPSKVKKWAIDDLSKTISWLES
ncbi:uncharacterized protein LOC114259970 [Camellia sinensis]|uniref:uncharacterized protein LOC114259970 n=1 Tax=Camellia sinensis TaxID=4442 RepID=UPI0010367E78|nr:uncharacterized protein LOC114259970 [Camellia sinensis]